jgi:hypothetical protein
LRVEFATGERVRQNFRIDTGGDGAKFVRMKVADEFAGVALPDRKLSGHADAREIFLTIGAQVFEENVAESNGADALRVVREEGLLHTLFVKWIAALLGNANFMERDAHRLGLKSKKIAPDTMHADAVETFSDSGEEGDDLHLRIELQSVQGHSGVFAAGPAEEDGLRHWLASGKIF